jgi:hypothetical protein
VKRSILLIFFAVQVQKLTDLIREESKVCEDRDGNLIALGLSLEDVRGKTSQRMQNFALQLHSQLETTLDQQRDSLAAAQRLAKWVAELLAAFPSGNPAYSSENRSTTEGSFGPKSRDGVEKRPTAPVLEESSSSSLVLMLPQQAEEYQVPFACIPPILSSDTLQGSHTRLSSLILWASGLKYIDAGCVGAGRADSPRGHVA